MTCTGCGEPGPVNVHGYCARCAKGKCAGCADPYLSNYGAADLIPNKITRRVWLGPDGQTTGKHSDGDQS